MKMRTDRRHIQWIFRSSGHGGGSSGKQLVKAGVVCGHAEEEGKKIR